MDRDDIRYGCGVVLTGAATVGALALAGYLLGTDVTTFPGSVEPATGLESGNVVLVAMAILPVLLAGIGLFGAYRRQWVTTTAAAAPLLIVGISGFSAGFFYVAIGLGVLVSGPLVATHPSEDVVSPNSTR